MAFTSCGLLLLPLPLLLFLCAKVSTGGRKDETRRDRCRGIVTLFEKSNAGNEEISTKPSRESKAVTGSTSKEDKTQETEKETHPHCPCNSIQRKNPQGLNGASSTRMRHGVITPHAFQKFYNIRRVLQHFHGSRSPTRTHHFKQRLKQHSLHSQ
ncbi:hypothetical protein CRG98_000932 [Punica granatum]|uniref:Secreted protein n=1 Tax=Punica granatum TaxID=22663 RepID=A0A2I0LDF6_PUNGR|nr:hypothetical protein CRG98_000932 [Punica granatum]